jgi:hypothetical protein
MMDVPLTVSTGLRLFVAKSDSHEPVRYLHHIVRNEKSLQLVGEGSNWTFGDHRFRAQSL